MDREAFEQYIFEVFSDPEMEEAIYIASPTLYNELKKWQQEPVHTYKRSKLVSSLYKYFIRMSTRCTPYGLFAGCALGCIEGEETKIDFGNDQRYKHARLDMNYIGEIVQALLRDPIIYQQIQFKPNNSLYTIGNNYRYVEYTIQNKRRFYCLSSVHKSPHIAKVLAFSQEGKSRKQIEQLLIDNDFTAKEATDFTEEMIRAQLLVSNLEPTVTGEEFCDVLLQEICKMKGTKVYSDTLQEVIDLLKKQDNAIEKYKKIEVLISENFAATNSKDLVQTDLFFTPEKNNISQRSINLLLEKFDKLLCLSNKVVHTRLENFRKNFQARYEEQAVPLLTALDSEVGIGYGLSVNGISDYMPLLKSLIIPGEKKAVDGTWNELAVLKFKKIKEAIANKQQTVVLSDQDLENLTLASSPITLPSSLYLFGSFLANTEAAIEEGSYKFLLNNLYGPSAANLMGRFCHGNEQLTKSLQACLQEEEESKPEAVFAEVVHLPEARLGNILMRPALRKYEIPYMGKASVSAECQISVDDLLVSVKQGKVLLWSKRLNKEVIPRLTSAHNYARGLPVYKFLCDLQTQEAVTLFWDWHPFEQEAFLPRVEYQNVILSRARWSLMQSDFQKALSSYPADLQAFADRLRQQYCMPRQVVLATGDNELLIDLECMQAVEILKDKLTKSNVKLYEFLGTPENCVVADAQGKYTNEVIIPLKKMEVKKKDSRFQNSILHDKIPLQRKFPIGSEWLYVKVYMGNKSVDKILTEVIKPLTDRLMQEKIIEQWFFIRYRDPDGHLRLRFHHSQHHNFWQIVLKKLYELLNPYLQEGIIDKIQIDTYHREVERYGRLSMELSERLFFYDSMAVINFLDLLAGEEGEKYRWLFALRGVDMLLDDFGYSLKQKHAFAETHQEAYFHEHHGNDKLKHGLNDKFRQERKNISSILDTSCDTDYIQPAVACFEERSLNIRPIIAELWAMSVQYPTEGPSLNVLISNYMHMFMNRMFLSKPRTHELVIYHYLSKQYTSQLARQKTAVNVPSILYKNS